MIKLPIYCSECGERKVKNFEKKDIKKFKEMFGIDVKEHSLECPIVCDECAERLLEEHDPCPICGKKVTHFLKVFCSDECHRQSLRKSGIDPGWFYYDCDKCGSKKISKKKTGKYDVRFTCNECGHYWEGEE
ncbi:MAG: hypothetical protein GF317_20800 [Candidatus Lokiarchaeota archaeon]|nr:hypothetical protein [Candidatus Lokiarchaeota archaeon]